MSKDQAVPQGPEIATPTRDAPRSQEHTSYMPSPYSAKTPQQSRKIVHGVLGGRAPLQSNMA